jgi:hypothetical protein
VAIVKGRNPLLVSKQREVAQRVLAAGFSRSDFEFMDLQAGAQITALRHQSGKYRFDFYPGDNWVVNYSPAEHTAESGLIGVGQWERVLTQVDLWLSYIRREEEVTNPWAAFAESTEPFDLGGDDDNNSPFSEAEQDEIVRRLGDIRAYLLDQGIVADADRHDVMARLGRIEDASRRLGRLDWRSFAIGALVELALIGYATPEGVRHAVNMLLGAAQRLLAH